MFIPEKNKIHYFAFAPAYALTSVHAHLFSTVSPVLTKPDTNTRAWAQGCRFYHILKSVCVVTVAATFTGEILLTAEYLLISKESSKSVRRVGIPDLLLFLCSLRSSLFRFLSGKRESREGMGTEVHVTKNLLSSHAFARLPLGSRFLPLRGNGKDCYAG